MDLINKIIISNDGSTDATAAYIEQLQTQFSGKIIVLPGQDKRQGIIPRFNSAIALCTSGVICEFQDDVQFTPGWLEAELVHIDKADFITGFDAPEHTAFDRGEGYTIKHSTRFTQLLARKATWEKWFPMKSRYDFPTPTFKDGRQIGSNIDANLYNKRKNEPSGATKFLVVPGLIHHTAEDEKSTWRIPTETLEYSGGLHPNEVKRYWAQRGKKQGGIAVGFAGRPQSEQEKILKEKKDFILPKINTDLRTVDYGCGVGHFSSHFQPEKYIGCDITESFLFAAKRKNRSYKYYALEEPHFNIDWWDFEQFFTTNVLQHNSNQVINKLLFCLSKIKSTGFVFSLYENIHEYSGTQHMCFRKPEDYVNVIGKYFEIKKTEVFEHMVHKEKHALIKIWV